MKKVNPAWLANLHYIEENGADFFATGGSQAVVGLDLNYIPGRGVNLSGVNQTLRQGYLAAKHIFEHVAPNTIKFVLIDLSPILFPCAEESEEFDARNIQATSAEDVDLNYERAKKTFLQKFPEQMLLDSGGKIVTDDILDKQSQILQDYAKLCFDNGARPVFVTFPVEQKLRKTYDADILARFRKTINAMNKNYEVVFRDLLVSKLPDDCFYGKSHLNSTGAAATSALLGEKLYFNELISVEQICGMSPKYFKVLSKYFSYAYKSLKASTFCITTCDYMNRASKILSEKEHKALMSRIFSGMTYSHLINLSKMLPKDEYNDLVARIFEISAEKIRHKSKIKIGFVLYDSSMWSGDDLYNLFARNERFEVTIFLCQRKEGQKNEAVHDDFLKSFELFKSHDLNVVALEKLSQKIPHQDVIILLTPYFERIAQSFWERNLTVNTLMTHIIYSYAISVRQNGYYNLPIFYIAWKIFFPSTINLEMYGKKNAVGMPRGLYSGYPRTDVFFKKDAVFHFDWKKARPDAKKIIWAPHHSINAVTRWATFQWNYQFMYEFAKAHPEISWIVKPHPNLAFRALESKVFPSDKAFKEYMQKWDDLPNAQVYTGAYYQAIFATSDGMIHDCGSFTAEYQYVDKPMIYLTREKTVFNELGNEIFKVSYLVDGKDFDAIAKMIQRVFIEGDDYKATERKEVFDKYLNYPKTNGMLASEFIYKSIADELQSNREFSEVL